MPLWNQGPRAIYGMVFGPYFHIGSLNGPSGLLIRGPKYHAKTIVYSMVRYTMI